MSLPPSPNFSERLRTVSAVAFALACITLAAPARADILTEVARCESGGKQFAANGRPLMGGGGGRYVGMFQFAPVHIARARRMGFDIYTESGNVGYAHALYREFGLRPWEASRHCWSRALNLK